MRRLVAVLAGVAMGGCLPAQGQTDARLVGAWLQTSQDSLADNAWTILIFNPDGTFCGGSAANSVYAEGTYGFDGTRLTTIGASGRVSEKTVAFGGDGDMVMTDAQGSAPLVGVRTDMFASCAAMKAHQGR